VVLSAATELPPGAPVFHADGALAGVVVGRQAQIASVGDLVAAWLRTVVPSNLLALAEAEMTGTAWEAAELVAELAWRLHLATATEDALQPAVLPRRWSESYVERVRAVESSGLPPEVALVAAAYLWDGAAAMLVEAGSADPRRLDGLRLPDYERLFRTASGLVGAAATSRPEIAARSGFAARVLGLSESRDHTTTAPTNAEHPAAPVVPEERTDWVELGLSGGMFLSEALPQGVGDMSGWMVTGSLWVTVLLARPAPWVRLEAMPGLDFGYLSVPAPTAEDPGDTQGTLAGSLDLGLRVRLGTKAGAFLGAWWPPGVLVRFGDGVAAALAAWDVRFGVFLDRALALVIGYRLVRPSSGPGHQAATISVTWWP
jgi:hypothetical protein